MERRVDMSSKLIVVKVGTGSLTKNGGTLDTKLMQKLVDQIAEAIKQGNKIAVSYTHLTLPTN